jgi:histidyl-tRNA synthetase
LRILDSKDRNTQHLLNDAPQLHDYLDTDSQEHFAKLTAILDAAGVQYVINQRLVRGLDYYGKTVFEWVTDKLGSQGTVCAGGRYDGLVEQLGGKPTPAVGFAMGIERLILLLETLDAIPKAVNITLDVYITALGGDTDQAALLLADAIRQQQPQLRVQTHCGGGSYKSQMKKAQNSSARFVILLENDDVEAKRVRIKPLSEEGEQVELSNDDIASWIAAQIS